MSAKTTSVIFFFCFLSFFFNNQESQGKEKTTMAMRIFMKLCCVVKLVKNFFERFTYLPRNFSNVFFRFGLLSCPFLSLSLSP